MTGFRDRLLKGVYKKVNTGRSTLRHSYAGPAYL